MTEACELMGLINHVQQSLTKQIEDTLKEHGLSLAKYNIIKELALEGGRLPFSTLVERLGCVRSNITGLIDRLQEDQLVRRVDHPEDRRMLFAELTPTGQQLVATTKPLYDAAIDDAFRALNAKQRQTLRDLLDPLISADLSRDALLSTPPPAGQDSRQPLAQ